MDWKSTRTLNRYLPPTKCKGVIDPRGVSQFSESPNPDLWIQYGPQNVPKLVGHLLLVGLCVDVSLCKLSCDLFGVKQRLNPFVYGIAHYQVVNVADSILRYPMDPILRL